MTKKVISSEDQNELFSQFENLINSLSVMKNQMCDLQQNVKHLEKQVKKHVKVLTKEASKSKTKVVREPSGFAKPGKVTKELCEFMNKSDGTEIARTEVTRALVAYIKENNLENKENSRIIAPDEKLKVLLGIEDSDELNYFNIQKYMNKHFVKNAQS